MVWGCKAKKGGILRETDIPATYEKKINKTRHSRIKKASALKDFPKVTRKLLKGQGIAELGAQEKEQVDKIIPAP